MCNHALLIKKSSKSKIQVVQEQRQLKDLQNNTCLTSSDKRLLDLNGRGPRYNSGIFCWNTLSSSTKTSNANIAKIVKTKTPELIKIIDEIAHMCNFNSQIDS